MTPIDKLKRRAIGATLDHRPLYLEEQHARTLLDLIAENERLKARAETLSHACMVAHIFVTEEREQRESAGGDMTDYVGEVREVGRVLAAALGIATEESEGNASAKGRAKPNATISYRDILSGDDRE